MSVTSHTQQRPPKHIRNQRRMPATPSPSSPPPPPPAAAAAGPLLKRRGIVLATSAVLIIVAGALTGAITKGSQQQAAEIQRARSENVDDRLNRSVLRPMPPRQKTNGSGMVEQVKGIPGELGTAKEGTGGQDCGDSGQGERDDMTIASLLLYVLSTCTQ